MIPFIEPSRDRTLDGTAYPFDGDSKPHGGWRSDLALKGPTIPLLLERLGFNLGATLRAHGPSKQHTERYIRRLAAVRAWDAASSRRSSKGTQDPLPQSQVGSDDVIGVQRKSKA